MPDGSCSHPSFCSSFHRSQGASAESRGPACDLTGGSERQDKVVATCCPGSRLTAGGVGPRRVSRSHGAKVFLEVERNPQLLPHWEFLGLSRKLYLDCDNGGWDLIKGLPIRDRTWIRTQGEDSV